MHILFIFCLLSIIALLSYSAVRLIQEEPQPVKVPAKSRSSRK